MASLRGVRAGKLLSVRDLAAKAGVNPATITLIENGRRSPSLRTIRRLADALDIEPSDVDEFRAAIEETARGRDVA